MSSPFYEADLAYVHDTGFGDFARGAAPFVLRRLREMGIDRGLVVDLGCGSGIWAVELLAAGYDVLGVDVSESMLALARRRAPGAQFLHGSMHATDVALPPCVAVTAIGECAGYAGPPRLASLFTRVHAALAPGGLFLFDVGAPSATGTEPRRGGREGDGWAVAAEVVEDATARTLTRSITIERDGRRSEELHSLRLYPPQEVLGDLRAVGFDAEVLPDGYGGGVDLPPNLAVYEARR